MASAPVAERYRRSSTLAHLGLEARASIADPHAGVVLGECPVRGMLALRGDSDSAEFRSAVSTVLGFDLVVEPLTSARQRDVSMLWLGPDEWLIVTPDRRRERVERTLREALDGRHAALVDVSHSRTILALSGPGARAVLSKGCPLDLHPRAFPAGSCAQSRLAKCQVLIHLVRETPEFEIYLPRSSGEYLWLWLEDAGSEFGVGIRSEV